MFVYLDLIIVLVFFVVILIAGFTKYDEVDSFNNYSIGRRMFSSKELTLTIAATCLSASGFFVDVSNSFSNGWYYLLPSLSMVVSLLFTAYILVPRMTEFLGKTSIATAMGDLYGLRVRQITGLVGAFSCIGSIAIQFKALGNIGGYFTDLPSELYIIIIGLIITVYSSIGGIRTVVKTDVIQAKAFFVSIPVLIIICLYTFFNIDSFPSTENIDTSRFDIIHVITTINAEFWGMWALIFYFCFPDMCPTSFQRIAMGTTINQVRNAWGKSSIMVISFTSVCCVIGCFIYKMNPTLANEEVVGYFIDNLTFAGVRGILLVGVIAMSMSTADSFLNASSILIANDCYKADKLSDHQKLLTAKKISIFIGLISIVMALYPGSLLDLILFTSSFYIPIVSTPLLFTIFGYRTSTKCVLIGMVISFISIVTLHLLEFFKILTFLDPIIVGILINAVVLIISHMIFENEKFYKGLNDDGYFKEYKEDMKYWYYPIKLFLKNIISKNLLTNINSTYRYLSMELDDYYTELNKNSFIKTYGLKISVEELDDILLHLKKLGKISIKGKEVRLKLDYL